MKIDTNFKKNKDQAARVFHPGEILLDEITERQLTQAEFSDIIGRPARTVNEIIKGKRGITPETAGIISAALGTTPSMWLSLQVEYDLFILNKKTKDKPLEIKERSDLYSFFPIADLVRRQYIKRKKGVEDLKKDIFELLGISSEGDLKTLVSARLRASEGEIVFSYLRSWVLLAKKIAKRQKVGVYDKNKLIDFSKKIKNFSSESGGIKNIVEELKNIGVRIVFLPHFSKTRVDGAACWLDSTSPVIIMSLRYERIDNFYFTLLHEIGHLILHDFLPAGSCFIDDIHSPSKDDKEEEANEFAVSSLGLDGVIESLKFIEITPQIINKKSQELGMHPSLLIGHLQYENLLNYNSYQRFLNKNKVKQMIPNGLIEN